MRLLINFIVILSFSLFSISFAESAAMIKQNSWQVGLDIGGGINYYDPADNTVSMHDPDHASFAWGFHIIKPLNQYFALKAGYLNFGNYENDGNGSAFCDTSGNCNYTKADILKSVFSTKLNINNQVLNQMYYLAARAQYPFKHQAIYATIGLAYSISKIESYVTVDPEVLHIGPTINEEIKYQNHQNWQPLFGIGWLAQLTPRTNMTVNAIWNYKIRMYSEYDGVFDGTLYPGAITVGLNYGF